LAGKSVQKGEQFFAKIFSQKKQKIAEMKTKRKQNRLG